MSRSSNDARGHCSGCERWFFIPSDTVHAMMRALCPYCFGTADTIEQQCGDIRIAVDVETSPIAAELAPS